MHFRRGLSKITYLESKKWLELVPFLVLISSILIRTFAPVQETDLMGHQCEEPEGYMGAAFHGVNPLPNRTACYLPI